MGITKFFDGIDYFQAINEWQPNVCSEFIIVGAHETIFCSSNVDIM